MFKHIAISWARIVALMLLTAGPLLVGGQDVAPAATEAATSNPSESIIIGLMVIAGMMIIVFALMLLMVAVLVDYYLRLKFGKGIFPALKTADLPVLLSWSKFTGLKGSKKEAKMDELLDHDYDGIQELDNAAPPIFNYILVGTIVFAVGYLLIFHVFQSAALQAEEYQNELEVAAAEKAERSKLAANSIDETNVTLLTEASEIEAGKQIFTASCVVCHGANGEGLVGPNLTDKYWIHGGDVKDLFRVIKKGGRPGKGMVSWEAQLTPQQMAQVSSYILTTFQGTNPPNGKAPEGDLYEPKAAPDQEGAASDSTAAPSDSTTTSEAVASIQ